MSARTCNGTTKKGTPCKATPLKSGSVIDDITVKGRHCRAHDPDLPASARFGSRAQATEAGKQGGRPKNPRVVDVLKERFEAEVEDYLAVLRDALTAEEAVTIGYGEHAYMELLPDHRTRLKALEIAFDRVYGRPKQQTELTGAEGGPIEMVPVARERGAEVVRILTGTGAISVPVPSGNGNGHQN